MIFHILQYWQFYWRITIILQCFSDGTFSFNESTRFGGFTGLKKALKSQFLNVLFNLDDYANFTVSGKLQLNTFFKKAFCSNFVQLVCVFTWWACEINLYRNWSNFEISPLNRHLNVLLNHYHGLARYSFDWRAAATIKLMQFDISIIKNRKVRNPNH